MLQFLVLGLTLSGNHVASQQVDEVIYKIDSVGAPVSYDRFLFLEKLNKFAHYLGEDPGPDAMTSKNLHDYSQSFSDNIVVLGFNGISIPLDISNDKKWEHGGSSCQAAVVRGNSSEFLVVCGPRDAMHTTTSVFKYQIGRGITGFFAPCFIDKPCWYKLESKKGILATLPPAGR